MAEAVPITTNCDICGKPLTIYVAPDAVEFANQLRGTAAHQHCYEDRDAKDKAKDSATRLMARQQAWGGICPGEFRKKIEFRMINCSRAKYNEVMTWAWGATGLLLYGPSGRCKTRFAYALLDREFQNGWKIGAVTHPELRQRLSGLAYADGRELARFVVWLSRVDILLIDDLGKGEITPASEEGLAEVIDQRYRHERPIIYTTNDGPDRLHERLSQERGAPLIRRIMERSRVIEFE